MKKKISEPFIPATRGETIRRRIMALLTGNPLSARELSAETGISEKDVYDHLEHIRKTAAGSGQSFIVAPAACRRCNFVFRKRDRLGKPGKCPVCRGESIQRPMFSIRSED